MHTFNPEHVAYSKYPVDEQDSIAVSPAQHLDNFMDCLSQAANHHDHAECLLQTAREAERNEEVVRHAAQRLCAGHFHSSLDLRILLTASRFCASAQQCLAQLLLNNTLHTDHIGDILLESHFLDDVHSDIVSSVFTVARQHSNSTVRLAATVALGSISHLIRESHVQHRQPILQHLQSQLQLSTRQLSPDEQDLHVQAHLAALANSRECKAFYSVLPWLRDERSAVRHTALRAFWHFNCSAAEQLYVAELQHEGSTLEAKAAIVQSLHSRHQHIGLNKPTLHLLRQHALAEIGTDSELEDALRNFYEENGEVSAEDVAFWESLQSTKQGINDVRHRTKRAFNIDALLKPLVDSRIGINKVHRKLLGFKYAAARSRLTMRNLLILYASLFDGKMEIDIFNEAQVKVTALGFDFNLVQGVAAFNAGLGYKNPIPYQVLNIGWSVIKNAVLSQTFSLDSLLEKLSSFTSLLNSYQFVLKLPFLSNPLVAFLKPALQFIDNAKNALANIDVTGKMYQLANTLLKQLPDVQFIVDALQTLSSLGDLITINFKFKLPNIQNLATQMQAKLTAMTQDIKDVVATIQKQALALPGAVMNAAIRSVANVRAMASDIISSAASLAALLGKFRPITALQNLASKFSISISWNYSLTKTINSAVNALTSTISRQSQALKVFAEKGLSTVASIAERAAAKLNFISAINAINNVIASAESGIDKLKNVSAEVVAFYKSLQASGAKVMAELAKEAKNAKNVLVGISVDAARKLSSSVQSAMSALQNAISTVQSQVTNLLAKTSSIVSAIEGSIYSFIDNTTKTFFAVVGYLGKDLSLDRLVEVAGSLLNSQLKKLSDLVNNLAIFKIKSLIEKSLTALQDSTTAKVKAIIDAMANAKSQLKSWVLNKLPSNVFTKIAKLSRNLIDAAAQFKNFISSLESIADSVKSFVQKAENIVIEGPRIDLIATRLSNFVKGIQIRSPLQLLKNIRMDLLQSIVSNSISKAKNAIQSAVNSLDIAPQLRDLLSDFRGKAETIVTGGLRKIQDTVGKYATVLQSTAKQAQAILLMATDFVSFKLDIANILPKIDLVGIAANAVQSIQQKLSSLMKISIPAIDGFVNNFIALKTAVQSFIRDHLVNLDVYIGFVCLPDVVCITDILRKDLAVITSAIAKLQNQAHAISSFLSNGFGSLQMNVLDLAKRLQALTPLQTLLRAFNAKFSRVIAAAQTKLQETLSKTLSSLQATAVQVKNIALSVLTSALDVGGFIERIRGFSVNVYDMCSFALHLPKLALSKLQQEIWNSAVAFSKSVQSFVSSVPSKLYQAAAKKLLETKAALAAIVSFLPSNIVAIIDGYMLAIRSVPAALLKLVLAHYSSLQWKNRPIDRSQFKPWQTLRQCSSTVCVRQIPVKKSGLGGVHLRTLTRQSYVIPGLVEDWQPQGICMLTRDGDIVLQALFGTGDNKGKQPLIVAMNKRTGAFLKIFVIATPLAKLETTRFGIANAVEYIYLFGSYLIKTARQSILHAIKISQFTSTLNVAGPSNVVVSSSYRPDAFGYGIYFEAQRDILWMSDLYDTSATPIQDVPLQHRFMFPGGLAIGVKLGVTGLPAVPPGVSQLSFFTSEALLIGEGVQDLVISKRHNTTYVALLRCSRVIGYSCRVEFREIPSKAPTYPFRSGVKLKPIADSDENLARVVPTPVGACALAYTGLTEDRLLVTFNSASQALRGESTLTTNDVIDRSFVFTFPVMENRLNPKDAVSRNELFLKVLDQYVFPPRELIPFDKDKKYSTTKTKKSRKKRSADDFNGCINVGGALLPAQHKDILKKIIFFTVLGIPMDFTMVIRAVWGVNFNVGICLAERSVKNAIIPYARVDFAGELAVNLVLVRFGIALVATVMDTKLYPMLTLGLTPSNQMTICVSVDVEATALTLSLQAFAEFFICFTIKCTGGSVPICYPSLIFCPPNRVTLYALSFGKTNKRVFEKCRIPPDTTPPNPGTVEAKQTSQNSIFSSWSGFNDPETRDLNYIIAVGSFAGGTNILKPTDQYSGTAAPAGNLQLPHGQRVYVTVFARNDEGLKTPVTSAPFTADTTPPDISVRDGNLSTPADVDYQWYADQIQAVTAVTDETQIVNTQWSIGSTPGGSEVQDFVDAGSGGQLVNANVKLQNNQRYYVTVKSIDILGMITTKTTNGVLVDTTNPVAGVVADGSYDVTKDRDYMISTVNLWVSWDDFRDPESPIDRYEWKLMDSSGAEVFPFRHVGLMTKAYENGLNLKLGQFYRTLVRGWNKAGLYTDMTSDGVTVDYTVAACSAVLDVVDGRSGDVDYIAVLPTLKASWSCQDPESGIVQYRAAVGSFQGGKDLHPYIDVPVGAGNTTVTFSSFSATVGTTYYILISIKNGAGMESTEISDGIMLDDTAPHIARGYLYDTLPLEFSRFDQDYQTTATDAAPQWRFVFLDSESPVVSYNIELLDSTGAILKEASYLSTVTTSTLTNLTLDNGGIYRVRVNCTNEAGLTASTLTDGFMVDTTPPRVGSVFDGQVPGKDIKYWHHATSTFGNYDFCLATNASDTWPPRGATRTPSPSTCSNSSWYDWESGLQYAETAVLSRNGTLVVPWQYVSVDFDVTGRSGKLPQGGTYVFALRLYNKAGLRSQSQSDGVTIDTTDPVANDVYASAINGSAPLGFTTDEFTDVEIHYNVSDPDSGIKETYWSIGTYRGGSDFISPTKESAHDVPSVQLGPLFDGQSYYVTVTTRNGANQLTVVTSAGFTADRTAPQVGVVLDGWSRVDTDYQAWNTSLSAQWMWTGDNVGLASREVGIGSSPLLDDIISYRPVSLATFTAILGAKGGLSNGKKYFLVREQDKAGLVTVSSSNGIIVDATPPVCNGQARDGLHGDNQWFSEVTWFSSNWDRCEDNDTSIKQYMLGLTDTPSEMTDNVVPYISAGKSLAAFVYGTQLSPGTMYYTLIKAVNNAGQAAVMLSNGFSIDNTPPNCSYVRDGLHADTNWLTSAGLIAVNFDCSDPESGILKTEWAIGTSPGAYDIQDFVALPSKVTSRQNPSLKMKEGTIYFSTVRVTNGVGWKESFSSNGIGYDTTPPNAVFINDGTGRQVDQNFTANSTHLAATWSIVDIQSGIQSTLIGVGTAQGLDDVVPMFSIPTSQTSATVQGSFQHGRTYYVTAHVTNKANLSASLSTNGVLVDTTAPNCTHVLDGAVYGYDLDYQTSTGGLGVNWKCSDPESGIFSVKRTTPTDKLLPLRRSANVSLVSGYILKSGARYTVNVSVTNRAGLTQVYQTNGVIVDITPPTIKYATFLYNTTLSMLTGTWLASDVGSGVLNFSLTAGHKYDGDDVLASTSVGNKTSISSADLGITIEKNKQYFLTLEVQDKVGLKSQLSLRVTTDATAPIFTGKVSVAIVYPGIITTSPSLSVDFAVSWYGITDPETELDKIELAVVGNGTASRLYSSLSYRNVDRTVAGVLPSKAQVAGVAVRNKNQYQVIIRATNGAGLASYIASDLITASFGVFTAGVVRDGPELEDTDYQSVETAAWCSWRGFRDPTHGIQRYEWALGSKPGQTDVVTFATVSLRFAAGKVHGLNLTNGQKYFATVCAVNSIGQRKCSTSDGVTVDVSPPAIQNVKLSSRHQYLRSGTEVRITWTAFDNQSSISHSVLSLGTYQSGSNILQKTNVGDKREFVIPASLLTEKNSPLYATVMVFNQAQLSSVASSVNSLIVDDTPPQSGVVSLSKTRAVFALKWSGFRDAESGIGSYRWCLGSEAGLCDMWNWTDASTATVASAMPSRVLHGEIVFATVEATDGAGLTIQSFSEGLMVDETAPVTGTLWDGLADTDIDYQSDDQYVAASWTEFSDDETSIIRYEACLGTVAGRCDVEQFMDMQLQTTATFNQVPITQGTKYYITVKATNAAGLSSQLSTDGVVIDSTPPEKVSVIASEDGVNHVDYSRSNQIRANWLFRDTQSGIGMYEWALCQSEDNLKCVQAFKPVNLATNVTNPSLPLTNGQCYVVIVRATNHAGLQAVAASPPVTFDSTPPLPGLVSDGSGLMDIDYQSHASTISASWTRFTDKESGILKYDWCVGSALQTCDVLHWSRINSTKLAASVSNVRLRQSGTYYVSVRAANRAGLFTVARSDGVKIDTTLPACSGIRDGNSGLDTDFQSSTNFVSASWDTCNDGESGIKEYQWAIGTAKGYSDIMRFTSVGRNTSVRSSSHYVLSQNETLFVTVRAINGAGRSKILTSDGVVVDSTAPLLSQVHAGSRASGPYGAYSSQRARFSAHWLAADSVSGIVKNEWAICAGDANGEKCVQEFADVRQNNNATSFNALLVSGVCYYAKVRATNGAGLSTTATTSCTILDWTAPDTIQDAESTTQQQIQYPGSRKISTSWAGFVDKQSGIAGQSWCIGSSLMSHDDVMPCTQVNINTTTAIYESDQLKDGQTYYTTVRAENGAGLSRSVLSNILVIDTTPPRSGVVVDGINDRDANYSSNSAAVSVSWALFSDNISRIAYYDVAIGSAPGVADIHGWTNVGLLLSATLPCQLSTGSKVYSTVRAWNKAKLSTSVSSNGIIIDSTPPFAGLVWLESSEGYQSDLTQISARWSGFSDPQSGVAHYMFKVCALSSTTCLYKFVNVGRHTNATSSANLKEGTTYVVILRAYNGAGLYREVTSLSSVTVDSTPPQVAFAYDGLAVGSDIHYQTNTSELSVNWNIKDSESLIDSFEVCARDEDNQNVSLACQRIQNRFATSATLPVLLGSGKQYIVEVTATNAAGVSTSVLTNGVAVITHAPQSGQVLDGNAKHDIDYQFSMSQLSAHWMGFTDNESSIVEYQWSIGTSPTAGDVLSPTSVGKATTSLLSGLNLINNKQYFVSVIAYNLAGLTATVTSNGVLVDQTLPVAGSVYDGLSSDPENDIDYQVDTATVAVTWQPFSDPESGIDHYEYSLLEQQRTDIGESWDPPVVVQKFNSVGLNTSILASSNLLLPGRKYTSVIRGYNRALRFVESRSDGFVIELPSTQFSVETWSGDERYGTAFVSDPVRIPSSILLTGNTSQTTVTVQASVNDTSHSLDPKTSYHLSIPSVQLTNSTGNFSSDTGYQLTGEYGAENVSMGTFEDHSSPCCSRSRLFEDRSHFEMKLRLTEDDVRITSVTISSSGYIAVCSTNQVLVFHSDQPTKLLYRITSPSHQKTETIWTGRSYKNTFAFVSADKAVWMSFNSTGKPYVHQSALASDVHSSAQFSPHLAVTSDGMFVVVQHGNGSRSLCSIGLGGFSLSKCLSLTLTGGMLLLDAIENTIAMAEAGSSAVSIFSRDVHGLISTSQTVSTSSNVSALQLFLLEAKPYLALGSLQPTVTGKAVEIYSLSQNHAVPSAAVECAIGNSNRYTDFGASLAWQPSSADSGVLAIGSSNTRVTLVDVGTDHGNNTGIVCAPVGVITSLNGGSNSSDDSSVAMGYELVAVTTDNGTVHMSAFCNANNTRRRTSDPGLFPIQCSPCTNGSVSSGGVLDNCRFCDSSVQCLAADQDRINAIVTIPAAPALTQADTYILQVHATSDSGRSVFATSAQVELDVTPPLPGSVLDGTNGEDADYLNIATFDLGCTFGGFDDPESGIRDYQWCVGTTPGTCNFFPLTPTGNRSFADGCPGCSVVDKQKYYVTVVAYNWANLSVNATSNGFLVDLTAPEMKYVNDGYFAPDEERVVFQDTVLANWKGEDEESGIQYFNMSVGTTPHGNDIASNVEAGNASQYIVPNVNLQPNTMYYVTVTAVNFAGLSANMSSNGFTVGESLVEIDGSVSESTFIFFDSTELSRSAGYDRSNESDDSEFLVNQTETVGAFKFSPVTYEGNLSVTSKRLTTDHFNIQDTSSKRSRRQLVAAQYVNPASTTPEGLMSGNYSFDLVISDTAGNSLPDTFTSRGNFSEVYIIYRANRMLEANYLITDPLISSDELDIQILKWNTSSQLWLQTCSNCTFGMVGSSVDRNQTTVMSSVDEFVSPQQFAMFFSYADQYGVFGMKHSHICISVTETNVSDVDFLRRKGAYGPINITWQAETKSGYTQQNVYKNNSLLVGEGEWNSSFTVPLQIPSSRVGYIIVNLLSTQPFGNIDKPQLSILVLRDTTPSGVIEFDHRENEIVVTEQSGRIALTVIRRCSPTASATVRVQLSYKQYPSTALQPSALNTTEYVILSPTIKFNPGQETALLLIDIVDDNVPELNETLSITLVATGNASLGAQTTMQIVILENDDPHGVMKVATDQAVVREGNNAYLNVTVLRDRGLFGSVQLAWCTSGITATGLKNTCNMPSAALAALIAKSKNGSLSAVADFIPMSSKVTLAEGQASADLRVYIVDDVIPELNESFIISLTGVTGGATLGQPRTTHVTILPKNDHVPLFSPTSASVLVQENSVLKPGVEIYSTSATDPDLGVNGQLTYSLHNTTRRCGWVAVNPKNGTVSNLLPLMPWNTTDFCEVYIDVHDGGAPSLTASFRLIIEQNFTQRCRPGTFSTYGQLPCADCPIATFQRNFGGDRCTPCPSQKVTLKPGADSDSLCQAVCRAGTMSPAGNGLEPCQPCQRGTFQSLDRQSNCTWCPQLTSTISKGSKSLTHCLADQDGDGIPDIVDNCVRQKNTLQVDSDGDGNGDVCDCDSSQDAPLCLNNGFCNPLQRDYEYLCSIGFTGAQCDVDIDECLSNPCAVGSTCVNLPAMYQCVCGNNSVWGYRCNLTSPAVLYIYEGSRVGSLLGSVLPKDPVAFASEFFSYSISESSTSDLPFHFDDATGNVVLDKPLDREMTSSYFLSLTITSTNVPFPQISLSTSTNVTFFVQDSNDNKPIFTQALYSLDVSEDNGAGASIGSVSATDADFGSNGTVKYDMELLNFRTPQWDVNNNGTVDIWYTTTSNASYIVQEAWVSGLVSLDSNTGRITLVAGVSWLQLSQLVFELNATDEGSPPQENLNQSVLIIDINARNDFRPEFGQLSYWVGVYENETVGNVVFQVWALDRDTGPSGIVRYSVLDGPAAEFFAVDAKSGEITVAKPLDRESHPFGFVLHVFATDQAPPPTQSRTSICTISILLQDVNDNKPMFHTEYVHLAQRVVKAGQIIYHAKATDADLLHAGVVSFSLIVDASGLFAVTQSGLLRISGQMPSIRPVSYYLLLQASDNGTTPLYSYQRVVVTFLDPSDSVSIDPVPVMVDITVLENTNPNTRILNTTGLKELGGFPAMTPANFTLSGSPFFVLAGDSLMTSSSVIDGEKTPNMLLVLRMYVALLNVSTVFNINVTVLDENDNRPVFNQHTYYGVGIVDTPTEQLTDVILSVTANDADVGRNGEVLYTLQGPGSALFSINRDTGGITATGVLELSTLYAFKAQASDRGEPALYTTAAVNILVYNRRSLTRITLPCWLSGDNSTVRRIQEAVTELTTGSQVFSVLIYDVTHVGNATTLQMVFTRPLDWPGERFPPVEIIGTSWSNISELICGQRLHEQSADTTPSPVVAAVVTVSVFLLALLITVVFVKRRRQRKRAEKSAGMVSPLCWSVPGLGNGADSLGTMNLYMTGVENFALAEMDAGPQLALATHAENINQDLDVDEAIFELKSLDQETAFQHDYDLSDLLLQDDVQILY